MNNYYEDQIDYSNKLVKNSVKLLSYYLPQFHRTPENDLWHGEGFTEWTNVTAAKQLFEGHYQQHIPNKDIGYYILNNTKVLKKQLDMMNKSGVYGQIFYHYWFNGKMILEKPSQMLLKDLSITMPFCFCWANENWTMRWDGNDNEILLKQDYNEHDAKNFIQYLIPFFKDSRYIRINNQPILFVYRPASIPNFKLYKDIWKEECKKHSILPPFIIGTMTRGANNPTDYGMDAAVERVLHDWTSKKVLGINNSLKQYEKIRNDVLDYKSVANFYKSQINKKNFTYFRSLVPMWDNTPRYGKDAHIVHNSTPKEFELWLENLIEYTSNNLPKNKQFIIINAWNEWAEGAHLEPDEKFGYAYLNSIGRALEKGISEHEN